MEAVATVENRVAPVALAAVAKGATEAAAEETAVAIPVTLAVKGGAAPTVEPEGSAATLAALVAPEVSEEALAAGATAVVEVARAGKAVEAGMAVPLGPAEAAAWVEVKAGEAVGVPRVRIKGAAVP